MLKIVKRIEWRLEWWLPRAGVRGKCGVVHLVYKFSVTHNELVLEICCSIETKVNTTVLYT